MREILFRGKRLNNGEWIEGSLLDDGNGGHFICPGVGEDKTGRLDRVHTATVGQYTGLQDMNGNRIFEGDIVVYDNSPYNAYCKPQRGEIAWRNGSLCFKYRPWSSVMYRSLCSDDFFAAKCEVIGNIHDNQEMLGGGGDG